MYFFKKTTIYREDKQPYLVRYTLFACRWFSIKIHNILISDYDCMHDHPWAFLTFLLWGGYVEHNQKGSKVFSRWSLLFRPAKYIHRLEIHQPVWSLVITFRKVRPWGFITSKGWIFWKEYTPTSSCE